MERFDVRRFLGLRHDDRLYLRRIALHERQHRRLYLHPSRGLAPGLVRLSDLRAEMSASIGEMDLVEMPIPPVPRIKKPAQIEGRVFRDAHPVCVEDLRSVPDLEPAVGRTYLWR